MQQWFGLFAPAGTPDADRAASSTQSSSRRCRATRSRDKLLPQGSFIIPGTPEDLARSVARDIVAARQGGQGFRRQGAGLAEYIMSLEYAPRGLVGMLTPQANTTVEPEFNLLWPPGVAMINARLMSDKPSMSDARWSTISTIMAASLRQFANAPLGVVGAACTGASYLAGREREAAVVADIAARQRPSVHHCGAGGGRCVHGAEGAPHRLWFRPIRMISTAPASLIGKVTASRSCEIANVFNSESAFHPIYSLGGSAAAQALRTLEGRAARCDRHARDRDADTGADRRLDRLARCAGDVVQPVPRLALRSKRWTARNRARPRWSRGSAARDGWSRLKASRPGARAI